MRRDFAVISDGMRRVNSDDPERISSSGDDKRQVCSDYGRSDVAILMGGVDLLASVDLLSRSIDLTILI